VDGRALFRQLLDLAGSLGLAVRIEPFARPGSSGGGLCLLRGRHVILLDGGAPIVEQTSALAEAIAEALGPNATPRATSEAVERAIVSASRRLAWRAASQSAAARTSPLQRRVSVLRRPKPGLRAIRPK